ncbi:MAG: bidirectional hydrogenase complex protein HoxU [bacterium]|jgi:bidirectional [NiFe] hydrogenase diaphorase subunit|nr:bidirectional hydrogenase complex protein HoxU [bacterium]
MSASVRIKTLKIDGMDVSARGNESVLQVARENGIFIPSLCYVDGLKPVGACRLCLIEVAGINKLLPACTTEVWEGMVVSTDSERLRKYRRLILELIFSERNHVCSVCVSNNYCELQSLAQKLGMTHISVPYRYPSKKVDASHERFVMDHNRCIVCTRCVRVCDEIEGAHTWDLMGRGIDTRVISDLNQAWGESDSCTSCGKCVQVCPTGALYEKGKSSSEMKKEIEFLPYLTALREGKR